ncbi:MAG: glycosyltransferase family 2 protein [Acidobacteria bacterium]|nr:glycosyltransferase family 2 protein [Acidobacteriota bacterium]
MSPNQHRFALIIPALNEAESIGRQLGEIPPGLVVQTIVVDNGSTDQTGEVAKNAGAEVVLEPRRGYGSACLTGLARLRPEVTAVLFLDADLSHSPEDIERIVSIFGNGRWDMVIGSRVLGQAEEGALTPVQRFGNWLTTLLIRRLWGASFTDLGPLRIVSRDALRRIEMRDPDFGWTVEMQVKAARLGLRFTEIPVRYRQRRFGRSKVSGTITGSARAGFKILWTVYHAWRETT